MTPNKYRIIFSGRRPGQHSFVPVAGTVSATDMRAVRWIVESTHETEGPITAVLLEPDAPLEPITALTGR
jgi:hypothetical protein